MIYPITSVEFERMENAILTDLEDFLLPFGTDTYSRARLDNGMAMVKARPSHGGVPAMDNRSYLYQDRAQRNYMRIANNKTGVNDNVEDFIGLLYSSDQNWIRTLPQVFRETLPDTDADFYWLLPDDIDVEISENTKSYPSLGVFRFDKVSETYTAIDAVSEAEETGGTAATWRIATIDNKDYIQFRLAPGSADLTFQDEDLVEIRYQYTVPDNMNNAIFGPKNGTPHNISHAIDRRDNAGGVEQIHFRCINGGTFRITNFDTTANWGKGDQLALGRNGFFTKYVPGGSNKAIPGAYVNNHPVHVPQDYTTSLEIFLA